MSIYDIDPDTGAPRAYRVFSNPPQTPPECARCGHASHVNGCTLCTHTATGEPGVCAWPDFPVEAVNGKEWWEE
jgi:hypothetical protein